MDYEEKFALAEKRVEAKLGLLKHLTAFFVGNGLLTGLDLLTTPGLFWYQWPLLAWTLVLGVHVRKALGGPGKG